MFLICSLRNHKEKFLEIRLLYTLLTVYLKVKMAVFWDVALCGLVDIDRFFRGSRKLL
jgi:hypothetical protein